MSISGIAVGRSEVILGPWFDQVEKADREQLARWYRFLPSGDTPEQRKIRNRLAERFKKMGGMTPELSKKIGFGGE